MSLAATRFIPFSVKSLFMTLPNTTGAGAASALTSFTACSQLPFFMGLSVRTGTSFISPPSTLTVEVKILRGSLISDRAYLTPLEHSSPETSYPLSLDLLSLTFILQDMGQVIHVISLSIFLSPLHPVLIFFYPGNL